MGSDERSGSDCDRLAPFELRHLATLAAVGATHSFRLAGERLGYVQSAVSRQIATLEHAAGMRLVERARGASEVRLTQAGEVLLGHAEALLAREAAARADLDRLAQGETGAVRVGVPQGVGHRVLRIALAAFQKRRPNARVEAMEFPSDAPLFELVERGTLDFGFAGLPLEAGPFERRDLLRVPWALALPSRWRMPRHEGRVRLEDLAHRPLVARHEERSGPSLEALLEAAGVPANVVFRTDIDETVRGLVAAGVGAALLPEASVAGNDPGIAVTQLEGPGISEVVGLFWHRERLLTTAAVEFRAITCEICGRLQPGDGLGSADDDGGGAGRDG